MPTLAALTALLQSALLLLQLAQGGNVPPDLKNTAMSVAQQSINYVLTSLSAQPTTPAPSTVTYPSGGNVYGVGCASGTLTKGTDGSVYCASGGTTAAVAFCKIGDSGCASVGSF